MIIVLQKVVMCVICVIECRLKGCDDDVVVVQKRKKKMKKMKRRVKIK